MSAAAQRIHPTFPQEVLLATEILLLDESWTTEELVSLLAFRHLHLGVNLATKEDYEAVVALARDEVPRKAALNRLHYNSPARADLDDHVREGWLRDLSTMLGITIRSVLRYDAMETKVVVDADGCKLVFGRLRDFLSQASFSRAVLSETGIVPRELSQVDWRVCSKVFLNVSTAVFHDPEELDVDHLNFMFRKYLLHGMRGLVGSRTSETTALLRFHKKLVFALRGRGASPFGALYGFDLDDFRQYLNLIFHFRPKKTQLTKNLRLLGVVNDVLRINDQVVRAWFSDELPNYTNDWSKDKEPPSDQASIDSYLETVKNREPDELQILEDDVDSDVLTEVDRETESGVI